MALQISISNAIGARAVAGGGGIDPDAQAFITAASITDPTQQSAINQLVLDLKGYSIWTKFSAIYPFCGSTASQHKWNLKDPLDTNAAFRLVFSGGGTHSANGYQTNGVNAFAETYYNPSINLTDINSNHISIYSRTNNQGGIDMGGGSVPLVDIALRYSTNSNNWNMASYLTHSNTDSACFMINSRTASNSFKTYKNGSVLASSTGAAGTTKPNLTYHIGKRNLDTLWTNRQYAFASIGDGLTDTEAANFYTAVQAFQVTLGRSIGTQTVSDADAQAFVTNAGIVDQVEANAVNNLVIGLKADSLWTKMKAVYPFVGGTATTNKYNLKNPLDTDAAFRLVFSGGWTFSQTGALPNGTNAWANTFLVPPTNLSGTSNHVSYYSRTNNAASLAIEMGVIGSSYYFHMHSYYTGNLMYSLLNTFTVTGYANTSSLGHFIGTRTGATASQAFRNGISLGTNTNAVAPGTTLYNIVLGAGNNAGTMIQYTNRECAFASIGDGLTPTEAANLYTRVQAFNTTLNRQV